MKFSKEKEEKSKGIGVIILLFIVLIVLMSNSTLRYKIIEFINKEKGHLEVSNTFSIEEGSKLGFLKDTIVSYNNDKINGYNLKGEETFSNDILGEENTIIFSSEYIYLGDRVTGEIKKINSKGKEEWTYLSEGNLEYILERDNNLIILTRIEDIQGINILNDKGKSTSKIIIEDSSVFDFDINKEDKRFVVGSFKIDDQGMKSMLKYYSYSGELLWEKDFNNEIIQKVRFINGDELIVFTDNMIYNISTEENLLWSKDIKGNIKDILVDKNSKRLILLSEDSYIYLQAVKYDGRIEKRIKLDIKVNRIDTYNDNIVLYGKNNILKINNIGEEKVYEYENIEYVNSTVDYIVLFSKGEVKLIRWTSI